MFHRAMTEVCEQICLGLPRNGVALCCSLVFEGAVAEKSVKKYINMSAG